MRFDQVENDLCRTDAVDAEYLVALARTPLKHVPEHFFLLIQRVIAAWARVDADFSYIPGFRQVFVPQRYFVSALVDELRMQTQRSSDVTGRLSYVRFTDFVMVGCS
jgi:hypothetical protein